MSIVLTDVMDNMDRLILVYTSPYTWLIEVYYLMIPCMLSEIESRTHKLGYRIILRHAATRVTVIMIKIIGSIEHSHSEHFGLQ